MQLRHARARAALAGATRPGRNSLCAGRCLMVGVHGLGHPYLVGLQRGRVRTIGVMVAPFARP